MNTQRMRETWTAKTLLTTPALERLLFMMDEWLQGHSLKYIAANAGITRQRVGAILARVRCTRAVWRRMRHDAPEPRSQSSLGLMMEAYKVLIHPFACRLTPGQRGAVAWKVAGLLDVEIARRMAVSTSRAWQLRRAARAKLERLERKAAGTGRGGPASRPRDGLTELLSGPLGLKDLGLAEAEADADAAGGAGAHPPGGKTRGGR